MSALGQKQTLRSAIIMSALPPQRETLVDASRPHLAVPLPKSHMTMSCGSRQEQDGHGETFDHGRQQRDWP